jgi:hypothetical protein
MYCVRLCAFVCVCKLLGVDVCVCACVFVVPRSQMVTLTRVNTAMERYALCVPLCICVRLLVSGCRHVCKSLFIRVCGCCATFANGDAYTGEHRDGKVCIVGVFVRLRAPVCVRSLRLSCVFNSRLHDNCLVFTSHTFIHLCCAMYMEFTRLRMARNTTVHT